MLPYRFGLQSVHTAVVSTEGEGASEGEAAESSGGSSSGLAEGVRQILTHGT